LSLIDPKTGEQKAQSSDIALLSRVTGSVRHGRRKLLTMKRTMLRVLMLMCFVQAAFGTSVRPLELRLVSSHLTVVVTHREKPVAGIEIQVVPEGNADPVLTSTTDARGTVLVYGLVAGRYFLTASNEGIDAGK
jgi:hypothetical protein